MRTTRSRSPASTARQSRSEAMADARRHLDIRRTTMRSQQPQPTTLGGLRPEDLREAARFVNETALEALVDLEDQGFPLAIGNGREFPRESPQQRAAVRGLAILQESTTDAIAALYALAEALE